MRIRLSLCMLNLSSKFINMRHVKLFKIYIKIISCKETRSNLLKVGQENVCGCIDRYYNNENLGSNLC